MARAQFQKGQRVWVECVGAWAYIEQVQPVWAKGFEEPVRVTYDVGLGREFLAHELTLPVDDETAIDGDAWRLLRARNKWQGPDDCVGHPFPGTHPVVVTERADWGGWRVPGAEYDRDPDRIEKQARVIAAAPRLMKIAEQLMEAVAEAPHDAPPAMLALAKRSREVLREILQTAPAGALSQEAAREMAVETVTRPVSHTRAA